MDATDKAAEAAKELVRYAALQTIDNFAFLASNSIFRHEGEEQGMEGVRKKF